MALDHLSAPRGEFTVVIELGHKTDNGKVETSDKPLLLNEFCRLTETEGVNRQEAIAILADRHHLPRNRVYSAIEKAKKSVV